MALVGTGGDCYHPAVTVSPGIAHGASCMQTIGRYELIEKLGQGGMGAVYRARDTLLHRIVAVKVIATSIDQNAELRERFFREARAAGTTTGHGLSCAAACESGPALLRS